MLKRTNDVNDVVALFIETLRSKGVVPERVYMYGSQAKGTSRLGSDIDLVVVSPAFSEMPYWKRWEIVGDALIEIMEPIEAITLSPQEFTAKKERKTSFIYYVLNQPDTVDICTI